MNNIGVQPINLADPVDWEAVWKLAQEGELARIPAFVRVKSYRTLRAIASDHAVPRPIARSATVFWGTTGTGKSHRAWAEGGERSYIKSARSKFWDGYQGQTVAIIDEFRGAIDISYLLTWLDHYPVRVEIKGSTTCLDVERFYICSNLHPRDWYPDIDHTTYEALERRLEIIEMSEPYLAQ